MAYLNFPYCYTQALNPLHKTTIPSVLIFTNFTSQPAFGSYHANTVRNHQMLLVFAFLG